MCKQAGFYRGGHDKGKDIYADCLMPLKLGKPVMNVPGNDPIVQACCPQQGGGFAPAAVDKAIDEALSADGLEQQIDRELSQIH